MFFGAATRFFVSLAAVLVLSFLMPGFAAGGFSGAIPAALGAATVGYLVESVFGRHLKARTRGIVGFFVTSASVYLVQFLVAGMNVTAAGALVAGVIVGFADFFVPVEV